MKHILFLALFFLPILSLSAQVDNEFVKRTYPVDSCLYFMSPTNFLVNGTITLANGGTGIRTSFQSASSSEEQFMGRGRFMVFLSDLPPGVEIGPGTTGELYLSIPEGAGGSGGGGSNPPGGGPPYPVFVNGFLTYIDGQEVDPGVSISLQVFQFQEQSSQ